jgi:hypothetical protein
MDQQLDITNLIEAFKSRLAQLEYELLVANAIIKQLQQPKTNEVESNE